MKTKFYLAIIGFLLAFFTGALTSKRDFVEAQAPPSQSFAACMGSALADYMDTVIEGVGSLSRVKLVSPAFNFTNPQEFAMYQQMVSDNANFGALAAFAGNTYAHIPNDPQGRSGYRWFVDGGWKAAFGGKPVIFTEFGDFRTTGLSTPDNIIESMREDFVQTRSDTSVLAINYFNVLGNNPGFEFHNIGGARFAEVTSGHPKAGANSASYSTSGGFHVQVASVGGQWATELLAGPDIEPATASVNTGLGRSPQVRTVLRLCATAGGGTCAFSDPQVLIQFLKDLDLRVNGDVWVIVGPNEPATEHWVAPDCSPTADDPPEEFVLEEVACDQTYETVVGPGTPDFHSLRPYPASPCRKDPEPTYFQCGQDLVVKETIHLNRSEMNCEAPDAEGRVRCRTSINSSADISLGLQNATFPILGNTELVPNSTNSQTASLPLSGRGGILARVNEYASWYLNGISFRAEEIPATLDQIINLGGPLKKLLPQFIQTEERNNERGRIGVERHNQIVSCGDTENPEACYRQSQDYNRITDIPAEPNNPSFPYLPFSSTEDRVGTAIVAPRPLGTGTCNPAENPNYADPSVISGVTCVDLNIDPADTDQKNVYFAHIEEVNELGALLQSTYKTKDVDDRDSAPEDQHNEQNNTRWCELIESRTNPGDRLFGELTRPGEPEEHIQGSMNYQANLECEFIDPTPENIALCELDCGTDTVCQAACSNTNSSTCDREIFVPFSVQVTAPELKTTWERLVAGSQAVFKRIFPQVGPDTPLEVLEDIPGKSSAAYTSSGGGITGGTKTSEGLAGDPAQMRPGATAEIYFPHIGSVYDYFLKGIQKALRPEGIVYEGPAIGGGGDGGVDNPPIDNNFPGIACPTSMPNLPLPGTGIFCDINCNMNIPDSAIPAKYLALKNNFIRIGDAWIGSDLPEKELYQGQQHNSHAAHCFNDVVTRSLAAGVNPVFSLAIWVHESAASNYITQGQGTGCYPNNPEATVQDFGINRPSMAGNFDAQIKQFLRLPYLYPTDYGQCFPDQNCSMEAFARVYKYGASASCEMNEGAIRYASNSIKRWMENIAGGCGDRILYPTDMSCP